MSNYLIFLSLLIFTAFFVIVSIVTFILIIFVVKKDIEKRYKRKIEYLWSLEATPWGFLTKYSIIPANVILIYFVDKNIFRLNRAGKYYKSFAFTRFNYTTVNEKKSNIFICFLNATSLFLICAFVGLALYVGSYL